jgi:transcription initiation factor TFIIF subunit beta
MPAMSTLQNPGIPRVKVETILDGNVKREPQDEEMASPYVDDEDDGLDEGGDLDFTHAHTQLWLAQIPRNLWETWSVMGLDDEIEIGTIRLEGSHDNPQRVSHVHGPPNNYYHICDRG